MSGHKGDRLSHGLNIPLWGFLFEEIQVDAIGGLDLSQSLEKS